MSDIGTTEERFFFRCEGRNLIVTRQAHPTEEGFTIIGVRHCGLPIVGRIVNWWRWRRARNLSARINGRDIYWQ